MLIFVLLRPPISGQNWNTYFLIFPLFNSVPVSSILVTMLQLWHHWFAPTGRITPNKEQLDKWVTLLMLHWFFQRRSGRKAMHNTKKWVVSAKNPGIRDRWLGDVSEREPPKRTVYYHKSICPCSIYYFRGWIIMSSMGLAIFI